MLDDSESWRLHQACQKHESAATLHEIVAASPEAASRVDRIGMLPLHRLCSAAAAPVRKFGCNQTTTTTPVQVLLQAFPKALHVYDGQGRLPIHYACARGDEKEDLIRELLHVDPSIASMPCGSCRRRLPLHTACSVARSTNVVRHLLKVFPEAVSMPDAVGCLPLCRVSPHSKRTSAAQAQDGYTGVLQEKWRLLVDAYPGALFRWCPHCRKSPLEKHANTAEGREWLMQTTLTRRHLSVPSDKDGSLVLHMACRQPGLTLEVLHCLVKMYPPATSATDSMGQMPLHVAVANQHYRNDWEMWAVVEYLIHAYGGALYAPAHREGYVPVVLAFQNPNAHFRVLYALLRHNPAALLVSPRE